MGAHPKNKITRAERGKRRAGNTPSLKRDHRVVTVPLHKRGLVNSMLASLGLAKAEKREEKEDKKPGAAPTNPKPIEIVKQTSRPTTTTPVPKSNVQRTQHKG
jgi:hypothetical protein